MAYIEIWKNEKLINRRQVDEQRAKKGCRVRLGTKGKVRLRLGESKTVGSYRVDFVPDKTDVPLMETEKGPEDSVTANGLSKLDFSLPKHKVQTPTRQNAPEIEGYRILEQLGYGGMGTVWRAVQLSTKRQVALKLLGTHRFISEKAKARFEREVALAAKLTHPNIARIYDSGLHSGIYYYAMELVEGKHLDEYVFDKKIDQRQVLILIKKICKAVAFAHREGVIHRDLKPSNIIVSKDGEPHILDFGLAKTLEKDLDDTTISIEGEVAGTPGYMAPEQAAGRVETANELWDVYSLGVILYQLLTRKMPHDMSGSPYDVVKRKVEQDIILPRKAEPSIDGDMECLLLKALAREPRDRYESIEAFAADIENYLSDKPLYAKSGNTFYFMRKHILTLRKHTAVFVVAVLALLMLWAFFHEYSNIIESNNVTYQRDRTLQDLHWKRVLDSRIAMYQSRVKTAISNRDWQAASEELKRLRGALRLKQRLYDIPDIRLEDMIKQWEELVREGLNSSPIEETSPLINPRQQSVRSRYPFQSGGRFVPRSNMLQPRSYRAPSQAWRSSPDVPYQQPQVSPIKSVVGAETPLGIVKEAGVAAGKNMRLGNREVKSGHVFVTLKVTAERRYEAVSIKNWKLLDTIGRGYPILGVITEGGTLFGADSLSAYGSARSLKTNIFVFEVPETLRYADLYIDGNILGRIVVSERLR